MAGCFQSSLCQVFITKVSLGCNCASPITQCLCYSAAQLSGFHRVSVAYEVQYLLPGPMFPKWGNWDVRRHACPEISRTCYDHG